MYNMYEGSPFVPPKEANTRQALRDASQVADRTVRELAGALLNGYLNREQTQLPEVGQTTVAYPDLVDQAVAAAVEYN